MVDLPVAALARAAEAQGGPKDTLVNARFDQEAVAALKGLSRAYGISQSQVLRSLVMDAWRTTAGQLPGAPAEVERSVALAEPED